MKIYTWLSLESIKTIVKELKKKSNPTTAKILEETLSKQETNKFLENGKPM